MAKCAMPSRLDDEEEHLFMSSVCGVTSATNAYQTTNQSVLGKIVQDFGAIGTALKSGDLSTAQSALATFQQALEGNSQASASQPFGSNSQANSDYQSLVSALQSGNLSSAQKAFASLQTDLTSSHKAHHHHHHGSSGTSTTAQIINNLNTTQPTTTTTNTATVGNNNTFSVTA
jgi:hypothetical protein